LINLPYQQQQGLFAVGFYTSFLRMPQRTDTPVATGQAAPEPPSQSEPELPSQNEAVPQPDAPEPPQSAPEPGTAEESAGTAEPSGLDVNPESDTQAADDSDPLDSQSVFLSAADDDELEDPGNPGEPTAPQDDDAGAENPTSPFNS